MAGEPSARAKFLAGRRLAGAGAAVAGHEGRVGGHRVQDGLVVGDEHVPGCVPGQAAQVLRGVESTAHQVHGQPARSGEEPGLG